MTQNYLPNRPDAFDKEQAAPDSQNWEFILAGLQRTGVISGCAVTESSPAAQTIDVAVGVVSLAGSKISVTAQADVAVTAADGTNPRKDLISINSSGTVVVTAGTAADPPAIPATPANSVEIGLLLVPANDNTHANEQINDTRVFLDDIVDVDHRFVDADNGNDTTGDGLSWLSAYLTVQKAHDDLPTGVLVAGGTIWVRGVVTETDVTITLAGVIIVGAGRNGTRWDVRAGANDIGLIIRGNYCTVANIRFRGENSTRTGGVWIDGAEFTRLDNVFFNAFGKDVAVGDTIQAGAFGLIVSGGTNAGEGPFSRTGTGAFSDWTSLTAVHFFNCYRPFVNLGGANGQSWGCTFRDSTENGTLIRRKNLGSGAGTTWRFTDCWWVGLTDGKYLVRLEDDVGGGSTNCRFDDCVTEGASGSGLHHFQIESSQNMIMGHRFFGGGDAGENAIGVNFTSAAINNYIGPYTAVAAGGFGIPSIDDAGTDNRNDGRVPKGRYRSPQEFSAAITLDSNMGVVNMSSDGGTRVVTTPDAVASDGLGWLVRRRGSNTVTINLSGGDTFDDGDTTKTLDEDKAAIGFFSVGDSEYQIVDIKGTVGGS